MQNKDGEIINNYELKNNLFDSLNRQNDDLKYSDKEKQENDQTNQKQHRNTYSKQSTHKHKEKYITSISFAHSKPIHQRKKTYEYSNFSYSRPKTSLDVNLYSNLDSDKKINIKDKLILYQNLTDFKSEKSLNQNETTNKLDNANKENYKTVDNVAKKDIIMNNVAFMESDSYCDTIFGKNRERRGIPNSPVKPDSSSNKRSLTILPFSHSNSK